MRGTVGARVADFVTRTAQQHIAGSEKLQSRRSLQSLMRRGSREPFQDKSESSMFAEQVASTHGGLLFSRSPAKFWHKAPGQLRDVDLSGCYNQIVGSINLYLGRPVVFEPGRQRWTLRQAIELVRQHAPRDGFLIRVTGNISTMSNTLIPSTINALTSDNYRSRTARRRARNLKRYGFELDYLRTLPDALDDWGGKLYSRRIESGIVTDATWLMIQALPPHIRDEYENLVAETIVFYPNRLIAHDGAQYDSLVEELESEELPWDSVLDVESGRLVRTEHFDADYAAMRYPIGEFAQRVAELRAEAKERHGKGSGAEKAWKLMANTMFGVLASDHVDDTNYVAANQITATGRAIAFAMMMSLNGIQVITDGCTYRADQIPASTFSNCLQKQPDYPLRRAEEGEAIEFCNGMDIPSDNREFTLWFREHVKRFFEVSSPEYDELFSLHSLEHKTSGEPAQTTFDALGVDGSGNYLKCRVDDNGWTVEDFAARSYKKQSKKVLKDWLVEVYSTDNLTELPPITSDTRLLKVKPAQQKARAALAEGIPEVFMPLGLPDEHVMNYKIIKPSGFVFQTPDQHRAFVKMKDKFENDHGCGLELVAFRRTIRGRRKRGSIADVATWIYELIQAGEHDFVKPLNLNRWGDAILAMVEERLEELDRRRQDAKRPTAGND